MGPTLGRPYVDQIKGSKYKNLKELRTKVSGHLYRSLFASAPDRRAIILSGGDKQGKKQARFYQQLIAQAESVFESHLTQLRKK
jgi:hypothetical protein